jgi:hypothetical protein
MTIMDGPKRCTNLLLRNAMKKGSGDATQWYMRQVAVHARPLAGRKLSLVLVAREDPHFGNHRLTPLRDDSKTNHPIPHRHFHPNRSIANQSDVCYRKNRLQWLNREAKVSGNPF